MVTTKSNYEEAGNTPHLREHIRSEQIKLPKQLLGRRLSIISAYTGLPFCFLTVSVLLASYTPYPDILLPLLVIHFVLLLAAQRCFQTLVHDLSHRLFSTKLTINDFLGNYLVAGWIGSTIQSYRVVHFKHHAFNGSKLDPEHIDMSMVKLRGGLTLHILRYVFCLEALRLFRKYYWPEDDKKSLSSTKKTNNNSLGFHLLDKSHVAATQIALFSIFYLIAGTWQLYVLWIYIAVSWSPLISGLRFLVEHPGKSDHTVSTKSWFFERLYFAPFNFNYHFEHHVWPSVPPYQLKNANRYLQSIGYYERYPENMNSTYLGSLWHSSVHG